VGMSSRGFGSVRKHPDGHHVVCEDYQLITVDCVSNPSAPGAFVKAIQESVLNKNFSLNESALALKILQETAALDSVRRPDGSSAPMKKFDQDEFSRDVFAGHAGFPSTEDARTALERCDDNTARILAALLGLQDEVPIDNEGLERTTAKRYMDSVNDPI